MANFAAIAGAGRSIERMLNAAFHDEEPIDINNKTRAVLVRTNDFKDDKVGTAIGSPALSIFFYRVDFNKTMRAAWSAVAGQDGRSHLALDVHFLITPWGDNAEFELRILGKAMQAIETTAVLSGPLLHPSAGWAANESVQLVMEEISTEAVMRIFDSLPTDYRLSVPYIARLVRIDGRTAQPTPPATTAVTGLVPEATP